MRTGEVAERVGVNIQTLRYYERRGILPEPPRLPGGYRDYPADAVRVVRFVKRAQELGFSLSMVEELLQLADGGPDNCEEARAVAEAHLAEVDRRIAELQRIQVSLAQLVDTCGRPRVDRTCPVLEAIGVPTHGDIAQPDGARR